VVILIQSCATKISQTDALLKEHHGIAQSAKIMTVPFIKQSKNHCAPASLLMIFESLGKKTDLRLLSSQMITPGANGTYSTDLISSIRRQGMLGVEVNNLENLLVEINAGNPVLVFQNLGFSFYPRWHYAVALGYELKGPDVILHSGTDKYLKTDMRLFERTWELAGNWGLVVIAPGKLSATGTELAHASSASGLERIGKLAEAQISYESILAKWPKSLPAMMGLGNIKYAEKNFKQSMSYLKQATQYHPESSMAWHNLAIAQGVARKMEAARISAKMALKLASASEQVAFKENLKDYLE
jgi:tetratricopeptide (TPR) repeat protein